MTNLAVSEQVIRAVTVTALILATLNVLVSLQPQNWFRRAKKTTRGFQSDIALICTALVIFWVQCIAYYTCLHYALEINDSEYVLQHLDELLSLELKGRYTLSFPVYAFYIVVWSARLSLLCFYKQLFDRQPQWLLRWRIATALVIIFFVGATCSSLFSCGDPRDPYRNTGCITKKAQKGINISLWFAWGSDVLSDLIIMFLMLWWISRCNLKMSEKISISGLFSLGFISIAVATARAVQTFTTKLAPLWVAIWTTVEACLAIVIATAPRTYRMLKSKSMTTEHSSYQMGVHASGYANGRSRTGGSESVPPSRIRQDTMVTLESARAPALESSECLVK